LDGFLAPVLGEGAVAPIVQEPVMQPVLVDRGELVPQPAIEIFEHPWFASHRSIPGWIDCYIRIDLTSRNRRRATSSFAPGVDAEFRGRSGGSLSLGAAAAWPAGASDRLVHDAADGARAAPALGAAAEAAIDLAGGPGIAALMDRGTHVVIAEHVAGTHDHAGRPLDDWFVLKLSILRPDVGGKRKRRGVNGF